MNEQKQHLRQSRKTSFWDPGNLLLVIYIAVVVVIVAGSAFRLNAAEGKVQGLPDKIVQGQLYMVEENDLFVASPLKKELVAMSVSGIVNRVEVEQHFVNSSKKWMEAIYAFPLPDESAIDHLTLYVGERKIIGVIQEKKKAEKSYQKAKEEGRKASLLVQHRPNIFTTKVANIAPGEKVIVKIAYQQTVKYESGVFSFRFPMVIFPRYIPGTPLQRKERSAAEISSGSVVSFSEQGWAVDTDSVPDASKITPPVDIEGEEPIPVELSIDLAAGVALAQVRSRYHGMRTEKLGKGHYQLVFTGEVKADRDFVLEWQPVNSSQTSAAFFSGQQSGEDYSLLMLMPPHSKSSDVNAPRELVLIIDISGSMSGPSLRQAKEGVKLALQRLREEDIFNIIVFNDKARAFYPQSVSGERQQIEDAIARVESLRAEGGTEMREALQLAFDGENKHSRLRQVVFLTDGAVGNERELLEIIASRLGDSRLFTVGIGSAPNSYFMTRAAEIGRGSHLYIGDIKEVASRMRELFLKLENPALRDLQINAATTLEIFPQPLPDLYYGEPLFVAIKGSYGETLRVSGKFANNRKWQVEVDTGKRQQRTGIDVLWARKKIRSLMQVESLDMRDSKESRQAIVDLGLKHHLVTAYTSLVAVDQQVSRQGDEPLGKGVVKTALPHGANAAMIFAGGAQSGTTSETRIVLGMLMLAAGLFMLRRQHRKCERR